MFGNTTAGLLVDGSVITAMALVSAPGTHTGDSSESC